MTALTLRTSPTFAPRLTTLEHVIDPSLLASSLAVTATATSDSCWHGEGCTRLAPLADRGLTRTVTLHLLHDSWCEDCTEALLTSTWYWRGVLVPDLQGFLAVLERVRLQVSALLDAPTETPLEASAAALACARLRQHLLFDHAGGDLGIEARGALIQSLDVRLDELLAGLRATPRVLAELLCTELATPVHPGRLAEPPVLLAVAGATAWVPLHELLLRVYALDTASPELGGWRELLLAPPVIAEVLAAARTLRVETCPLPPPDPRLQELAEALWEPFAAGATALFSTCLQLAADCLAAPQ